MKWLALIPGFNAGFFEAGNICGASFLDFLLPVAQSNGGKLVLLK